MSQQEDESPSEDILDNRNKRRLSQANLGDTGKEPAAKKLFAKVHHKRRNRCNELVLQDFVNTIAGDKPGIVKQPSKDYVGVYLNSYFAMLCLIIAKRLEA
ncbi:hypothetical protein ColLi_06970 [Colletotrichum liriopes]|uniref:Uncharacterized protein n=1 Tax=Colletotrichum liriopes TaxID=708192 RepID=A0AA37LTR1_9PEZI|nr:hypothetical protein ColLi_06970 [Colletotrichum liriopes]